GEVGEAARERRGEGRPGLVVSIEELQVVDVQLEAVVELVAELEAEAGLERGSPQLIRGEGRLPAAQVHTRQAGNDTRGIDDAAISDRLIADGSGLGEEYELRRGIEPGIAGVPGRNRDHRVGVERRVDA